MSFAELKRSSKTSLSKLNEEITKIQNPTKQTFGEDERIWKPTVDKAGNGFAIIRFLPSPEGEDMPFVRVWDHGFQDPDTGMWYIEKSLTTLGLPDPVSEANSKLWNTGLEENKKIAQHRKRRLKFVSNIYVIKDSANPENEGEVFLYEYGKKIFTKINDLMNPNPAFPDEKPINPFDLWNGATFTLKIRNVEGYRNYDKSEFTLVDKAGYPLLDDDDKLEEIWKSEYPLSEFIDPTGFKSYDELLAKFNKVIGLTPSGTKVEKLPSAPSPHIASRKTEEDITDEVQSFTASTDDDDDEFMKTIKSRLQADD